MVPKTQIRARTRFGGKYTACPPNRVSRIVRAKAEPERRIIA